MYEYRAHVRSVYDADTIRADIDLGFGIWTANQPLRLNGIDAPELGTPSGKPARDYLRTLLPEGAEVVLRTFKDATEKFGRILAEVYLIDETDPLHINQHLIDAGFARAYDGGPR